MHTHCLICGSQKIQNLDRFNNAHLCQCQDCNFIFSKQIPTDTELKGFYTDSYDITRYFSPITEKRFNELLDVFEKERKTNRILDVGAGHGFFLEVAKKRGWEVSGTELIEDCIERCESKGINMFQGKLEDIDFNGLTFDIIVSIEVIEHLSNPIPFVTKVHELLEPEGLLYVTTPNFNSVLRYTLKEKYDVIEYPNHLCYFTPKSLKSLMTNQGFEAEMIKTTGFSFTRLKTSKGKSDQDYVTETSDDEMLRYRIEKNKGLKLAKYSSNGMLNLFKVGDSLKGYFRKK